MASNSHSHDLTNSEVSRYSRQLILDEFGPAAQTRLKHSSCLIVGLGGLGCPAATYLAAAGIGKLGLVDYDVVELGNLHRQVLHSEDRVGQLKVKSAQESLTRLNSNVQIECHQTLLTRDTALSVAKEYDVILDATDNVATRYLLNDISVILDKPLVSGSALKFEGQMTVYHHKGGPCYRCIFPTPPPPEMVTNCSSGGVIGAVPGIIGNLQALEAIKLLAGLEVSYSGNMLLFDGLNGSFRTIKLRGRNPCCKSCGDTPEISESLVDYEDFCGSKADDKCSHVSILKPEERISVESLKALKEKSYVIIDCRKCMEFEICHLPNSINLPLDDLQNSKDPLNLIDSQVKDSNRDILFLCHHGNRSQTAVELIKMNAPPSQLQNRDVKDIIGGIDLWARSIDSSFPRY